MQTPPGRAKLVAGTTAPLGFFALALLIIESFLGVVLIFADLPASERMTLVWVGVGMFALVMIPVILFVWFKPDNLTFDKEAHLVDRGKIPYGSDEESVPPEVTLSSTRAREEP